MDNLYCDRKKCGLKIEGDNLFYDSKNKAISHYGTCIDDEAFETGRNLNVIHINRNEALKLLEEGKLKQPGGLEKKV